MAKTEKLSRKEIRQELREPDVVLETGTRAMAWARQNSTTAAVAGGTVLAVLIGVGAYTSYQSAQLRDANADLAQAMALLQTPDLAVASSQLSEVADRWSQSSVGPLAALLAANSDIRRDALDEGLTEIGEVAKAELPDYLRQQLQLVSGNALEKKSDLDGAAEKYASAAQMSGPYTADAILGQARIAALKDDEAAAAEFKRLVQEQFPDRPK